MVNLSFGGPNGLTQGFNWVFLLELIAVVVVVIFLLFFFNRVLGFVVSYIIRAFTWHRYKAYIHVDSIQLSFLAGRILFKNFQYQSRNQSVYIIKGHITWQYWLRRTRVRENSQIKESANAKLPCRISIELEGAEWFIYNRTPAYDAVITAAESKSRDQTSRENGKFGKHETAKSSAEHASNSSLNPNTSESSQMPKSRKNQTEDESSALLNLLPIQMVCKKGAIILGNTNTPCIVVGRFVEASMAVDAAESRSKFDLYKMVYNCHFSRPTVQIKTNIDFKESLLARASQVVKNVGTKVPNRAMPNMWHTVRDLFPFFQESTESLARPPTPRPESRDKDKPWSGLPRYSTYLDNDISINEELNTDPLLRQTDVTEYAKVTTILDSTEMQISFYYDEPGRVPPIQEQLPSDETHIGNGDLSPEWGLDIEVSGGTISYGPWADRQRRILQEMFFPGTYEDAHLEASLEVGDQRVCAYFKVLVEFKDSVIFKIPTKEKSKDWKYSSQYLRSSIDQRVTARPFGWIELKASSESTITYHLGLMPQPDGWTNFLNLELKRLRVITSINYGIFTEAEGVRIQCDLSNPLKWDAIRNWIFNVTIFKPSIFMLRDHVTLFTDCGSDWTSAAIDYTTWIPFIYTLNINLIDFSLFFNVNDGNIISSPSELNDNLYVKFRGEKLSGKVVVPSDKISPMEHSVQVEWQCPALALSVHAPLWNTLSVLLRQQEVGQLHKLEMTGSYIYPSEVSRNSIETLDLQVSASYASVLFYGFFLRYFFNFRNNYFGDHTHFITLEEYQREAKLPRRESLHAGKRPPVSSVLDVIISVEVAHGAVILPSRLYEASDGIRMNFDMFEVDVRIMDHFMGRFAFFNVLTVDLQINVTPISYFHHLKESMGKIFEELGDKVPQLFVNGIKVHSHRLLGNPPSNPAYVCNWDFEIGMISGEPNIAFLQAFNSALDSFVYNFIDVDNALPEITPPDRDVTFLRANAAGASLRIPVDPEEIRVQLGPAILSVDDRTSLLRSLRATISVESFAVQVFHEGKITASFKTALRVTNLGRRQDLLDHRRKQSNHVRDHDAASKRAWFLYSKKKGHAHDNLETFEIDLPPLDAERIANIHSRPYTPKCTLPTGKSDLQDIHVSTGFLPPHHKLSIFGEGHTVAPSMPDFQKDTPLLHSSRGDIILTHVDDLPSSQNAFIVEVSPDTALLVKPDAIRSIEAIFQAFESTDPVASLDQFQRGIVSDILSSKRNSSTATFAKIIIPKIEVCLQDNNGLGFLINIVDLSPQFRSVHFKDGINVTKLSEAKESCISFIASLRSADITVFHHDPSIFGIPNVLASQRKNYGYVSLKDLNVKVRQGFKTLGSISIGNIDGTINSERLEMLTSSVKQWLVQVNDLFSTIQAISRRYLCKSRNLVMAIVLAGEKHGVSNDPPFLTRPSHVLRISKNLLRVDDSWKISARIRHIDRSLSPETRDDIAKQFSISKTCIPEDISPVMQILSRWRSWEITNIKNSYFFRWLSGETDNLSQATASMRTEGELILHRALANLDSGDGRDNSIGFHKVVVHYTELSERSTAVKATNTVGLDLRCEALSARSDSDALDLLRIFNNQRHDKADIPGNVQSEPVLTSSTPMTEYRGTILFNRIELSGRMGILSLMTTIDDLRMSAFSRLRRYDELESPSICLSFEHVEVAMFDRINNNLAAQLSLDHFSAQMLSIQPRPGVAAGLGSITLRLSKPLPWLIREIAEILHSLKSIRDYTLETPVSNGTGMQKPALPSVTFRLNQASIEAWLVPNVLLLSLASKGFQAVSGELSDNNQCLFIDIPPATISLHRTTAIKATLAEVLTPFVTVKALIQWQEKENLFKFDSDIQIGTLSLSMTSLALLFPMLASEQVASHLTECQEAIEDVQKQLLQPLPVVAPTISKNVSITASYRLRFMWESIEVVAETPEAKILLDCADIYISLSNRSNNPDQLERVQYTAGSQNTSLSLHPSENAENRMDIMNLHWEIGNSVGTDENRNVLYRSYFISNALLISLSPRFISETSRAIRHIIQEVDKLQIRQTIKDLNIGPKKPSTPEDEIGPIDGDINPFQALKNIDAVRVSFSELKFKWIAGDNRDDSHGFTFHCKTVDASVLDRATRGRFVVRDGGIKLNCLEGKVSNNFAGLPKLDFNVYRRTEADGWRLQFDAQGDTVQINFTPSCIEAGQAILESFSTAAAKLRIDFPSDVTAQPSNPLAAQAFLEQTKKLKAVVTSTHFSGARINAQYDQGFESTLYMSKYRVSGDGCEVGALHIPGLALRSRYSRKPAHVFHAEICILESSNILSPQIKPFIHDLLHRIERVMSRRTIPSDTSSQAANEPIPDTAAILGDVKFSVGLRVQPQELTLTCDPFSKVDAKVGIEEIYGTLIGCKTADHNQFFAMTVTVSGVHGSLQHQYSGIASAKVKLNDLHLSMFNNYQIRSSEPGISAILKSNALDVSLNARQGQDFLIFNSLWLEGPPPGTVEELRQKRVPSAISMQQLQKVTISPTSFPINITILLDQIKFALDLGQSIGTTDLEIRGLRISNRKCSEYHHVAFVNIDSMEAESKGRFSGYMNANKFATQTSIYFQDMSNQITPTPLVQIDVKLGYVEFRTAFEYHVFLIGDSSDLRFTIYNRRMHHPDDKWCDRLVSLGDSELIQLYATAEGPALVLSLYKAVIQLKEEKELSREKELATFNEIGADLTVDVYRPQSPEEHPSQDLLPSYSRIFASRVDMEMSIRFAKINVGIFKAALNDSPVFRINVSDIRALFSQTFADGALENLLEMSLGNLGIALSPLRRIGGKELGEMKVEKWIKHVSSMRGGVILAVPETDGSMWTKQEEDTDIVKHIFKSRLDGKVDVGWNYGSVMYVQELWKTFQLKLKEGEEARVTHSLKEEEGSNAEQAEAQTSDDKDKVEPSVQEDESQVSIGTRTFSYVAEEPAIIETPQLRQMGDATPPVEWIGVNRMRLPAFTHQAFIVPLQKVSRRVEMLYNLTLQNWKA